MEKDFIFENNPQISKMIEEAEADIPEGRASSLVKFLRHSYGLGLHYPREVENAG